MVKINSTAKSPRGVLLSLLTKFRKDAEHGKIYTAKELEILFTEYLSILKATEKNNVGIVELNSWKGKSGIVKLIKSPDKIIVVRFQKPDKLSEPKEVKMEITKEEINAVINALNKLSNNQPIKTRFIAMLYSEQLKMYHYDWKMFFADRAEHNKLCNILDALDKEGLISYVGGKTTILSQQLDIQMVLPSTKK